ncbi:type II toxin-antitoxin system RelE/ParE family toxin [Litoribacillus peritrichatus]|uniref:Type II toxin-antitoxin system RelE/ParE family toxin n=1 Tax=Litoribacillus peritrichatus TaxID=718191 RepID=A0ABP7M824_9GAMM
MNLVYTEQAIADMDMTTAWYERQLKGLGLEFLASVEQTVFLICENPTIYPVKHKTLRAALLRRFPFTVFYEVHEKQIIVHALFDNRQDPKRLP